MLQKIKFNLLLKSNRPDNYSRNILQSSLIQDALGHELIIPEKNLTNPFIFSCFALSQDGKLCYPDTQSGLDIAKCNHQATSEEKTGDLFWLMMARAISDGIILSSNIFKKHSTRKKPTIKFEELIQERIKNNKPAKITPIIFCRNLNEIDFEHEMLADITQPFIIFYSNKNTQSIESSMWNSQKLSDFNNTSNKIKHLIFLDLNFSVVFNKLNNCGYGVILNESPYFHHKLLEAKLLNEIWLNYSCVYIGGNSFNLGSHQTSFTTNNHPESKILDLYNIDYHFLYSRQLISYAN